MKIAFFGYDYTMDIAQRLMADGHEILQIFTFPCDNVFSYNVQIKEFAEHFNIPITEYQAEPYHIEALVVKECTLFLCAGYPYKIPAIDEKKAYGINLHPSLLPRAKGIMPLPFIMMHEPEASGFTLHKLTDDFDAGDILYQEAVPIDEHTDIETLNARIAVRLPPVLSEMVENVERYWKEAKPQNKENSSSYKAPNNDMRLLDWNETARNLRLKAKAFGRFGNIATIKNNVGDSQKLGVFQFTTWEDQHTHKPGTLMRSSDREIVVAIKDGYVCLKEFQVIE